MLAVNRAVIWEGVLQLDDIGQGWSDYAHLFLLSDFLVFAHHILEPDEETSYRYTYFRHAGLASSQFAEQGSLQIELRYKTTVYVLTFESPEERNEWFARFTDAQAALQ